MDLTEFEKTNSLFVKVLFEQYISCQTFKFFSNTSPLYMNYVLKPAGQHDSITKTSLLKLHQPYQKPDHGSWTLYRSFTVL